MGWFEERVSCALANLVDAIGAMGHATKDRRTLTDGIFAVANSLEGIASGTHAIASAVAAKEEQPK